MKTFSVIMNITITCLIMCLLPSCNKYSDYDSSGEGIVKTVGIDTVSGDRFVSLVVSRDTVHIVYLEKTEKIKINKGDFVIVELGKLLHHLPADKTKEQEKCDDHL